MLNSRAKTFLPLEAILSKTGESWAVGGVASNFFKDLDGDAISPAAIQQAIPGFMANRGPDGIQGGPLRLHHGFWERFLKQAINGLSLPYDEQIRLITAIALPLGRVTEMSVDADGTTRWRGVLSQANPIARVIWDMLREGMIHLGVSVGGKINAVRPGRDVLGRPCNVITSVRLDELSITDNPANRLIESESPDNGAYIMALAKSLTLEKAVRKPSPGQLGLFEMPAAPSGGLRPKNPKSQGPKDGDTKPAKGKAGGMLVFGKGKWRRQDNANKPGGLRPKASQPARSTRALAVLNDDAPAMGTPKQKGRPRADRNWQSPKPPAAMGGRGMAETSLRPKAKPSLPEPLTLGDDDIFERSRPVGEPPKHYLVDVAHIKPSKPASAFDPQEIESLAQSILESGGLLKPVALQENGPMDYSVLSGDLEYHAAARAKQINPRAAEMVSAFVVPPSHKEEAMDQLALRDQLSGASNHHQDARVRDPRYYLVDVADIKPSKPASAFDQREIESLAQSILATGQLLSPLVVQENGPMDYSVLSGDLEYYAAARARQLDPRAAEMVSAFVAKPNPEQTPVSTPAGAGPSEKFEGTYSIIDINPSTLETIHKKFSQDDLISAGYTEVPKVPPQVIFHLNQQIGGIRQWNTMVESARRTDRKFSGDGRYTWEATNGGKEPDYLNYFVDQIEEKRQYAEPNGVDFDKLLDELNFVEPTRLTAKEKDEAPEPTPEPTLGEMLEQQQAEAEQPMPEPEPAPAEAGTERTGNSREKLEARLRQFRPMSAIGERDKPYYNAFRAKVVDALNDLNLEKLDEATEITFAIQDKLDRRYANNLIEQAAEIIGNDAPMPEPEPAPAGGEAEAGTEGGLRPKAESASDTASAPQNFPKATIHSVRLSRFKNLANNASALPPGSTKTTLKAAFRKMTEALRSGDKTLPKLLRAWEKEDLTPDQAMWRVHQYGEGKDPYAPMPGAEPTGQASDDWESKLQELQSVGKSNTEPEPAPESDAPAPHTPEFKAQGGRISPADISYYAHDPNTGLHHIIIGGERYSYEKPRAGEVKNFRHVSGDNKIVARTYKSFRGKLGIEGGSSAANALITKLHENKSKTRNLKKTGTIMGNLNSFLAKALGGSPGKELTSGSWQDTTTGMGRGLGAPTSQRLQGSKQIQMDNSSSAHAGKGIGGKQPKAQRPYSSGGMPPTDVWGMTMTQLTRELAKCSRMDKEAWGSPETVGFLTDSAHAIAGITDSPHAELVNFVRFLQNLGQFAQALPHMDDYQAAGTVVAMNNDLTKALDEFVEKLPTDLKGRPMRPPGSPGVVGLDIQFPNQYIVYS